MRLSCQCCQWPRTVVNLNRGSQPRVCIVSLRPAFSKRGPTFTDLGASIRCGRSDGSSQTIFLHYTNDGACCVRVAIKKAEYFIPVVVLLKAFFKTSDRAIYDKMVVMPKSKGVAEEDVDSFVADRVEIMLRLVRRPAAAVVLTRDTCS